MGTWEWDGDAWELLSPATSPASSSNSWLIDYALAFDARRGVTVLLGLARYGPMQTWEWDGVDWTRRAPATVFPWGGGAYRGMGGNLAYDSSRGVVLFMTSLGGPVMWEWDGVNWYPRATSVWPPMGIRSMAYDALRERLLLVGNAGNVGSLDETWEWNGEFWGRTSPVTQPPGGASSLMTFDSARGTVVMLAFGFDGSAPTNWEWNGADWMPIPWTSGPSIWARGMAYDSNRDRIVVHDATSGTWEFGPEPAVLTTGSGSEAGGDFVLLKGLNTTSPNDTAVYFGNARAEVVGVAPDRVGVRTPSGSGTVDVSVSNSRVSVRLPSAFDYIAPSLAARYGNVGVARNGREDVLLVNAISGDPVTREAGLSVGVPLSIVMQSPSTRSSARFAIYAWPDAPDATTARAQPHRVGTMVFPTPLDVSASLQPIAIGNNLAPRLGVSTFAMQRAPTVVARRQRGLAHPLTLTVQGFIQDDGSAIPEHISVTNAVILRVTP